MLRWKGGDGVMERGREEEDVKNEGERYRHSGAIADTDTRGSQPTNVSGWCVAE